jgi:hypothetical protein
MPPKILLQQSSITHFGPKTPVFSPFQPIFQQKSTLWPVFYTKRRIILLNNELCIGHSYGSDRYTDKKTQDEYVYEHDNKENQGQKG